jgi:Lrp/AsnC family transcriptional regulator for asnA, asnC and gidA
VEQLGKGLAELPMIRYAAAIAGDHQIIADVTVEDMSSLYRFITGSDWAQYAAGVNVSVLLDARKRGGRFMRASS